LTEREYTVRVARPVEAPAILDLWHAARSSHAITPDRIEYVHRLLAETPGSLLVADGGGVLLGTLIAAWDGWRGNMYRLVVLCEHRRRGVGLALVRAGNPRPSPCI
jgi:ribosomal protein S18 acetylase RimI-like enzyme